MQIKTITTKLFNLLESSVWYEVATLPTGTLLADKSERSKLRHLHELLGPIVCSLDAVKDAKGKGLNPIVLPSLESWLASKRFKVRILQLTQQGILVLSDQRGHVKICKLDASNSQEIEACLSRLTEPLKIVPHGEVHNMIDEIELPENLEIIDLAHSANEFTTPKKRDIESSLQPHLAELEQEAIHIIREAVANAERPAMLFSLGKDSMAMLRLAEKAFAPEQIPFPLVNIDTRWKFQAMNEFRNWVLSQPELKVIHYVNPDAIEGDVNPFDHGSAVHTEITKTLALKQVLEEHNFDFVFGGARRDEEKSRAKERVFSVRSVNHLWDPRDQRPEFWNVYNTTLTGGQTMRVFPLSNWTELDVWEYLAIENVPLVPLYFSKRRPFVVRNGALIMVDDERFKLEDDEKIHFEHLRFRSLGCYPLSGGVISDARTIQDVISELKATTVSERSSRVIDSDRGASMEQKKKEGYF